MSFIIHVSLVFTISSLGSRKYIQIRIICILINYVPVFLSSFETVDLCLNLCFCSSHRRRKVYCLQTIKNVIWPNIAYTSILKRIPNICSISRQQKLLQSKWVSITIGEVVPKIPLDYYRPGQSEQSLLDLRGSPWRQLKYPQSDSICNQHKSELTKWAPVKTSNTLRTSLILQVMLAEASGLFLPSP